MWFLFALGSSIFAALTSILAKIGIEGVNSNLATAIRTFVVLLMSWGMVFITNTQGGIAEISRRSWLFLILSGIATGASWLCYYKALQIGEASKVIPIDKLSVVITMILAAVILLLMSWGMVFITNTQGGIAEISRRSWLFLILSGIATGASWLCYYKALQIGEASKVIPIDKLSVVITMILAAVILHEQFTPKSILGCILIGAGTLLMVL